jgi:SulP family sulfate permease
MKTLLFKLFPLAGELRKRGDLSGLQQDLQLGMTLAFLAIPQCMAYALIAQLHPIYGLFAGIVTPIVAGLFMTSRHVVTGPTATVSLIVAGILFEFDVPPATIVIYLGLLAGLFQILFYLLNIGNLARFVSDSVVSGFIHGSAIVIIGGQVLSLLGAPSVKSAYFFMRLWKGLQSVMANLASVNLTTLSIGVLTVVFLTILRWWSNRIPSSLLLLLAGACCSWWLNLQQYNVEIIGKIPSLVPTLTYPTTDNIYLVGELFSSSLALALFCSVQCLSITKSIAVQAQDNVNENRELLGQGMANMSAGLLSGYPVGASFSRSFLNYNLGGRTQLSSISSGVFVAILTLLGAPIIYYIPMPVLFGIVIVVVAEVIELEEVQRVWAATLTDRVAFLSTFLGVLFLKLDFAIYLGVAVSLIFYLREATRLDMKEYNIDEDGNLNHITSAAEREDPRVAVIDVNGEAFFGAADQIQQRIRNLCEESDDLRVVILRMRNVTNFDITGATVLKTIARDLRSSDRTLILCGTTPGIRDVLEEAGVTEEIGEDKILVAQKNLLESTVAALKRAQDHVDEVLEGGLEREEEEPELDHTLEELDEDPEGTEDQDPVEQEKNTVYEEQREPENDEDNEKEE